MINKISDIKPGNYYTLVRQSGINRACVCRILAILNDQEYEERKTKIYLELHMDGSVTSKNLYYAWELGIGVNAKEAKSNLGRFMFEENDSFYTNEDLMTKEVTKKRSPKLYQIVYSQEIEKERKNKLKKPDLVSIEKIPMIKFMSILIERGHIDASYKRVKSFLCDNFKTIIEIDVDNYFLEKELSFSKNDNQLIRHKGSITAFLSALREIIGRSPEKPSYREMAKIISTNFVGHKTNLTKILTIDYIAKELTKVKKPQKGFFNIY